MNDRGPLPPDDLIVRIGVSTDHHPTPQERVDVFRHVGKTGYEDIVSALPAAWDWSGKRALDFGCGSGRLYRWFAQHVDDGLELVGCDIHQPTVEWMRAAYPGARFYRNDETPPLDESDGSFDLIFGGSVFSHLPDWAPWLLEMRRLLRPGGMLVVSIHGRGLWSLGMAGARGEPWDEDATGLIVERSGEGFDDSWGPAVYVSEWWLREHWGRALEIVEFHPAGFSLPEDRSRGQAWAVARRTADTRVPVASDLEAPSADLRELTSALRAQRLAYAEIAEHVRKVGELWREVQGFPPLWERVFAAEARVAELESQLAASAG